MGKLKRRARVLDREASARRGVPGRQPRGFAAEPLALPYSVGGDIPLNGVAGFPYVTTKTLAESNKGHFCTEAMPSVSVQTKPQESRGECPPGCPLCRKSRPQHSAALSRGILRERGHGKASSTFSRPQAAPGLQRFSPSPSPGWQSSACSKNRC